MAAAHKVVPRTTCNNDERKAMVDILDRLGDKWTIMIVGELFGGPLRYSELQKRVGVISQRMLTLSLKGLLDDGLVSRTVYPSIPPRVDYELTALGLELREALRPLWEWALRNMRIAAAFQETNGTTMKLNEGSLQAGLQRADKSTRSVATETSLRNKPRAGR